MPTYEYVCRACGHEFERFQKISERPIRRCPECGERKAERRISAGGGLVFKGPGFYATDYRKEGPKKTRTGGEGDSKADSKGERGKSKEGGSGSDGAEGRPEAEGSGSRSRPEDGGGEGARP